MRRSLSAVAAVGLSVGLMAGCGGGETTYEQDAQVVGFGYGEDVDVIERHWIEYTGQDDVPGGEVRNVDDYDEFVGCVAVDDAFFSFNANDSECGGLFYDSCFADEDQHCEARYETLHNYERLEDVVIRSCRAAVVKREVRPSEPVRNEECIGNRRDGQRHEVSSRYILWLVTENPEFDAEDEGSNEPSYLQQAVAVDASTFYNANRGNPVDVQIRSGDIISATVPDVS